MMRIANISGGLYLRDIIRLQGILKVIRSATKNILKPKQSMVLGLKLSGWITAKCPEAIKRINLFFLSSLLGTRRYDSAGCRRRAAARASDAYQASGKSSNRAGDRRVFRFIWT